MYQPIIDVCWWGDLIPLNFPLGCGPGSDPPQFPPWVWAWRGCLFLGGGVSLVGMFPWQGVPPLGGVSLTGGCLLIRGSPSWGLGVYWGVPLSGGVPLSWGVSFWGVSLVGGASLLGGLLPKFQGISFPGGLLGKGVPPSWGVPPYWEGLLPVMMHVILPIQGKNTEEPVDTLLPYIYKGPKGHPYLIQLDVRTCDSNVFRKGCGRISIVFLVRIFTID